MDTSDGRMTPKHESCFDESGEICRWIVIAYATYLSNLSLLFSPAQYSYQCLLILHGLHNSNLCTLWSKSKKGGTRKEVIRNKKGLDYWLFPNFTSCDTYLRSGI